MQTYVIWILLCPLIGVLINGFFGRRLGRGAHVVACGAVGVSWALSILVFLRVLNGDALGVDVPAKLYSWISTDTLNVVVGFRVDELSAVMLLVVTTVSFFVHVYSIGYMRGDPGYARYFTFLNLFVFSMLVLVLADNFVQMFVGWEAVGLCSYLLIGFWYEKKSASDAGKKAFIVNRIGDFGFLIGLLMIFANVGSLDFYFVFRDAHNLPQATVTAIALLLFVGAVGKSAQFPLYVWLPDAMEGPTPVSSLIHAATMVTAGVYMVARCHVLYDLAPAAAAVVAGVGAFTAFFAASIALVTNDIKRVLAYSTVSQLGYMFIGVGVGAYAAGIFHLMTHAFFKGLLFLTAGSVMHAMSGELDMRRMGGLKRRMPVTAWTFVIGAVAIAGVPPLAGFWSKDAILDAAFHGHPILWAVGLVTAFMTAFYVFRLIFMTFFGASRVDREVEHHLHESPPSMTVPLIVLAALSVVAGLVGTSEQGGIFAFLNRAFGDVEGHEGAGGKLGLMAVSVLVGLGGIFVAYRLYLARPYTRERAARPGGALHRLLSSKYYVDEIYHALIVQPVSRFAGFLWDVIDSLIVDGLVNLTGLFVKVVSWVVSRVQTGRTPFYATSMVVGTVVLLYYIIR
ncbi:MAG: NADH-quinone oxidoreductase subunit L [Candidatus Handelsmanbacteria bacterium RIFCSPLOWO2_12_FULL_64_10]|uniref:NADH-quinone oxidoreductase subunit L n=1 Tax=Handelsmanbacteria sp. (strain RIFCSPLOWO2_12_FULL_64_10) TaxID=1817868 RepID=A0A1F6C5C2_HANXR|nr:MAG: NADH-quinone oxidoreductase subunit L [Candidatus Handelsmanbacteria bacterium RIFCSPLOWO2_12_FULL_64_10]